MSLGAYASRMSDNCLFCAIVSGDMAADMVLETDNVVAFRDISPQAPVHVLVVPRIHAENVIEIASEAPDVWAEMAQVAGRIAHDECEGQFRWVFNSGERAGQDVFHVHGHVLGGKELGWNPA